jgi:hypothetical protein
MAKQGWFWDLDDWIEDHNRAFSAFAAAIAGLMGISAAFIGKVKGFEAPLLELSLALFGLLAVSDWVRYPLTLWTKSAKRGGAEVSYRVVPVVLVFLILFMFFFAISLGPDRL